MAEGISKGLEGIAAERYEAVTDNGKMNRNYFAGGSAIGNAR